MRGRLPAPGEVGETLLELVIAIAILGVSAIAIAGGIASSISMSSLHRQQSDAQRALRNYAETLQGSGYSPCTAGSPAGYSLPATSGFPAPAVTVTYWNGSAFQSGCPSGGDSGLQRVAISLADTTGRVSDHIAVVLRNSS
jgi:type II secretory pathway pseudopilin PulG